MIIIIISELINQLGECKEDATIFCIIKAKDEISSYDTIVLRTEEQEKSVNIIVMNTNGKSITVKELKEELSEYDDSLPVFIKENRLKQKRFDNNIIGITDKDEIVYLNLPKTMAGLFKQ